MILWRTIIYLCLSYFTITNAHLFNFDRLRSYVKYLDLDTLAANKSGNELWNGIIKDCRKKLTFSCIQKNAYTYLDNTLVERDNITVFDGFVLRRNDLDYEMMTKNSRDENHFVDNLVEVSGNYRQSAHANGDSSQARKAREEVNYEDENKEEQKTPLEEITSALHDKTVKFLATRDYEVQLPNYFFEGSIVKISPREIDERGALIRVDFGQRGLETEGRLFKKIKKFIRNKLLLAFFALILIIKLIKVKFLFVIPFLFGIGAAKKLFLKLILFLVPAFAHVFKLCSSYYSSHSNRLHHHHHQIAHHHHHVPVPVAVPTYYAPNHHSVHHEEVEGYDYPHPHIQYRKDIEELKEWGIGPSEDDLAGGNIPDHVSFSPVYQPNAFAVPQPAAAPRPPGAQASAHAQSLAYNGYIDDHAKYNRRGSATTITQVTQVPAGPINIQLPATSSVNVVASSVPTAPVRTSPKPTLFNVYPQAQKLNVPSIAQHVARPVQQVHNPPPPVANHQSNNRNTAYDDDFYGPIVERLDDIFAQLRFVDENCRERLLCSMYKKPAQYSPHSNLVSNELSRDPQELKHSGNGSGSSHRFYRYVSAARLGQDGGDCLRTYPCAINTE